MKRWKELAIVIFMALAMTACGEKQSDLIGTYEAVSAKVDDVTFTVAELEAMGDDSMSHLKIILKDGGKAYIIENDDLDMIDWEVIEGGVKIGIQECEIVDELICLEMDTGSVYFKKISDSQTLDSKGDTEEKEDNIETTEEETEYSEKPKGDLETFAATVEKDVNDTISELRAEYEALVADVNTYGKYIENVTKIEAFYEKLLNETNDLCIRLREYSVDYAELILNSDKSYDEKYDDLDELYDTIYEDARDLIYDEIYDGIREDMYDAFYDGIVSDGSEEAPYDEWLDVSSEAYEMWLDSGSDLYECWLDAGSEIYEFWLDIRSEIFSGDMEKAEEVIADFEEDIEKLKSE